MRQLVILFTCFFVSFGAWASTSAHESVSGASKDCESAAIDISNSGGQSGNSESLICDTTPNKYDSNVLALLWQPGFCKNDPDRNSKPECEAMARGDLVVDRLALHGLWPKKKSCNERYFSCGDSVLDLKDETVERMKPIMPNFYYSQSFAQHEWAKHGTCQALDDDSYFLFMANLVDKVNATVIGSYLRERAGGSFLASDYKQRITEELGEEVAERVELRCTGNSELQEIWINMQRHLSEDLLLKEAIIGSPVFESFLDKCGKTIFVEDSAAVH